MKKWGQVFHSEILRGKSSSTLWTYLVCFLIKTMPETSQVVDTIEEPSDKRNAIVYLALLTWRS